MTLRQLIDRLEREPNKDRTIPNGLSYPHSYRGYYDQLAFEPTPNVTVAAMLADAKSALGATYTGWKGGEFEMNKHTAVNLSFVGESSYEDDSLTTRLLDYMLSEREGREP